MDRQIEKKRWTFKRIVGIGGAFLLVCVIFYSFIFSEGGNRLNVDASKIGISTVWIGEFQEFIPVDGSVQPKITIRLDAIVGGVVEKKYLEGGILVKKGDTILKLSNNDLLQSFVREETQAFILVNNVQTTKLSLQRNQFELRRILTELDFQIDQAKDAFQRGKPLYEDKIISEQEYLNLKREYDRLESRRKIQIESNRFDSLNAVFQIAQAEETLSRTKQNLQMIKSNLDNLYITAPIDGQLSSVQVQVGESIRPGQNIGQIDDVDGFKVRATIDEHYISRIYSNLKGSFDFASGKYELVITKVYPEVNSGIFSVDLEFTGNIPSGIRRGQTLQIKLQLSENITAMQIPRGSFFQTTGGNWIFVVDASESFATRKAIKLGRQNPRNYEVLEGLQPGEKVVISSYEGYADKDRLIFK